MTPLLVAEWHASLTGMEAALAAAIQAVDRHQPPAGDPPAADATAAEHAGGLETRLQEWDARLTAAAEVAASVERQLNDRAAAVAAWQQAFTSWRELLERG